MIDYHGVYMDIHSVVAAQEPQEVFVAKQLFTPDDRVLVAGTGLGLLQAVIASIADYVIGYDIQPELVELVRQSVKVDGKSLAILHGALWVNETANLYMKRDGYWACAHIDLDQHCGVRVPVFDVSEEIARHEVNALALDVEGAEYPILQNVDLETIDKLLIEFHLERAGETEDMTHENTLERLLEAGFVQRFMFAVDSRQITGWVKVS